MAFRTMINKLIVVAAVRGIAPWFKVHTALHGETLPPKQLMQKEGFLGHQYRHPRKQVTELGDLRRADHIVFARTLFEHHGIVDSIHKDDDLFSVIEVSGTDSKQLLQGMSVSKIVITEHTWSQEKPSVYVVQYAEEECLPVPDVLKNARDMIGKVINYSPMENNCEHYASLWKTGKGVSEQAEHFSEESPFVLQFGKKLAYVTGLIISKFT